MTRYKTHYINKEYIELHNNNFHPYKFKVTNAIKLLRLAYEQKDAKEQILGFAPTCYVINNAIFIRLEECKVNRFTKHLSFNGGFIPLHRIETVEII